MPLSNDTFQAYLDKGKFNHFINTDSNLIIRASEWVHVQPQLDAVDFQLSLEQN